MNALDAFFAAAKQHMRQTGCTQNEAVDTVYANMMSNAPHLAGNVLAALLDRKAA